jgi:hypothetical protein
MLLRLRSRQYTFDGGVVIAWPEYKPGDDMPSLQELTLHEDVIEGIVVSRPGPVNLAIGNLHITSKSCRG